MASSYPQFVLFGDSLFQNAASTLDGFSLQASLQELFIRRYDVVNRGFSGYNTSQALHVLPSLFPPLPQQSSQQPSPSPPQQPQLAILAILLGANDAALPAPAGQPNQHVSLAEYEANLRAIVTHPNIAARKPGKILLVTPPPLDGFRRREYERFVEHRGPDAPTSRQARVTAAYAAAARRVAQDVPGVELVDLWTALTDLAAKRTPGFGGSSSGSGGSNSGPSGTTPAPAAPMLGDEQAPAGTSQSGYLEKLLTDGLHLSGEGYRVLFGELKKHVGGPSTAGEGWVYPEWRKAPWLKKEE